jgi:uncharacterized FlaG/YvyC family protein
MIPVGAVLCAQKNDAVAKQKNQPPPKENIQAERRWLETWAEQRQRHQGIAKAAQQLQEKIKALSQQLQMALQEGENGQDNTKGKH